MAGFFDSLKKLLGGQPQDQQPETPAEPMEQSSPMEQPAEAPAMEAPAEGSVEMTESMEEVVEDTDTAVE
jgi:hypothetical protein